MDVTVSTKYQVVIPKEVRRQMGLVPGDKVRIVKAKSGQATFSKVPPVRQQLDELLRMSTPKHTDAVRRVRRLREEWDR